MDSLLDRGYSLPVPKSWVVRENKWKAARYGLDAEHHRGRRRAPSGRVRDALVELVEELAPVARRLDCAAELAERARRAGREGPSARRQRAVVAAGGTLVDVVDALIEELAHRRPVPLPATGDPLERAPRSPRRHSLVPPAPTGGSVRVGDGGLRRCPSAT